MSKKTIFYFMNGHVELKKTSWIISTIHFYAAVSRDVVSNWMSNGQVSTRRDKEVIWIHESRNSSYNMYFFSCLFIYLADGDNYLNENFLFRNLFFCSGSGSLITNLPDPFRIRFKNTCLQNCSVPTAASPQVGLLNIKFS